MQCILLFWLNQLKDMKKSLSFYEMLLQAKPAYANEERWVTFDS